MLEYEAGAFGSAATAPAINHRPIHSMIVGGTDRFSADTPNAIAARTTRQMALNSRPFRKGETEYTTKSNSGARTMLSPQPAMSGPVHIRSSTPAIMPSWPRR